MPGCAVRPGVMPIERGPGCLGPCRAARKQTYRRLAAKQKDVDTRVSKLQSKLIHVHTTRHQNPQSVSELFIPPRRRSVRCSVDPFWIL